MIRAFGVVVALAVAALAVIVGVIAFNASSNDDQQQALPPGGGGGSAGAPHGSASAFDLPVHHPPELVHPDNAVPVATGGDVPPPPARSVRATFSGGSGAPAAPPPPPRAATCDAGLLASLLATVGALLGGSGAAC